MFGLKARSFWKSTGGFTLVELLVVISLIGILAGVTVSIINPIKQRRAAEDGVRQSNLQKYALGIEAYANANGEYPATIEVNENNVPTDEEVKLFVSKVPNDEPTDGLDYTYKSSDSGVSFGVSVPMISDDTKCLKYTSSWGKIKECVVADCGEDTTGNDSCND